MTEFYQHIVAAEEEGRRLDRWLADRLPQLSRSRVKALIEAGMVSLAGETIRAPAHRVKPGDAVRVAVPDAAPAIPQAEAIPLAIVHEDEALVVIDKPPGMVVHPAPGAEAGTLVNALLHHCGESLSGIGGVRRPGIVHRIDKDTSGLLVIAKTDAAHRGLAEQFAAHSIGREYIAFVHGCPQPPAGRIEGAIGRHPVDRKRMAVVTRGGKHAVTHYATERCYRDAAGEPVAARVRCRLETGRTHQVRVHMAHIGHPLIGDPVYGGRRRRVRDAGLAAALGGLRRQALHAARLGFRHPLTGENLQFSSALPYDLVELQDVLERDGADAPHPRQDS
ncbi:MAG: RluA family pseudouridine synthase [Rhodothalassiaceae bacterium]